MAMATDGLGVTSDDGKTVSYAVSMKPTGTGVVLKQPCIRCGSPVVRIAAVMTLGGDPSTESPVIIDYCTESDCRPKAAGQSIDQPTVAIDRALLVE